MDLAADLPFAWLDRPMGALDLGDPGQQRRLTRGWYRIARPKQGEGYAWTSGRRSVIELSLSEPRDMQLELRVAPLMAPDQLPHQTLRLTWNGHDLGLRVLSFEAQTLTLEVPARLQRAGHNRLELFPLYWVSPASVGLSRNTRPVGVQLLGLRLVGVDEPVSSPTEPAFVRDGDVVQTPDSLIAWHYVLPHAARLRGRVRWQGAPPTEPARWRLDLVDTSGVPRTLTRADTPSLAGEGLVLDVDLAEHAQSFVAFESMLGAGGAATDGSAGVLLSDLRIEGVRRDRVVDGATANERPNMLVVLFDSLRADHLSPYGATPESTPEVSALAAQGVTFVRAVSNASWTRPSIASLWTGLRPSAHRVVLPGSRLSDRAPLLPALLRDAGYHTLAVSNNAHFSRHFGFDRGYDEMFEYFGERATVQAELPSPGAQADRVWSRFLEPAFLAAGDRPVFAVVHEIDPHAPYEPPPPYADPYEADYPNHLDGFRSGDAQEGLRVLKAVNDHGAWRDEAERRQLHARYRGEVGFVDAYLGELLQRLDAAGLRERTLVVLLSDHGEQFFEHGAWGHGRTLYQEELRIPLVFSLPGVLPQGMRSDALAQGIDLAPTLLDLAGVPAPADLQGRSLVPDMLAAAADDDPRASFARSNVVMHGRGTPLENAEEWESVRYGNWKLMRHTFKRAGETLYDYELYDLSRDPDEVFDRFGSEPVVGLALRQLLESRLASDAQRGLEAKVSDTVDENVSESLRALGYIE